MIKNRRKSYYLSLFTGLLISLFSSSLYSQLSIPARPYPLHYTGSPELRINDIVVTEFQKEQAAGNQLPGMLKPASTGMLIETGFTPESSGTWDTVENGMRIWRIVIRVNDAATLNLIFDPYEVEEGVRIFVYDGSQKKIAGAFTDMNNKYFKVLSTENIPGNMIIAEMHVPHYLDSYGSLKVSGVGCDFEENTGLPVLKDSWYGKSGYCNIDVFCSEDPMIRKVENSVVRIIFRGYERCTGTLINTTHNEGVNYILTAGHCFTSLDENGDMVPAEKYANSAVFYFNYESPWCDGPDGNSGRSLSGATIKAWSDKLDFALLEVLEPIPVTYHPYYSGWDYTGNEPDSAFSIHHPWGDVKKIAIEEHTVYKTTFEDNQYDYDQGSHFLIRHWENGTTEPGSSGAPLFNTSGRLTGTLTGGLASCGNPAIDYYQMFSPCWSRYPNPQNQLAYWLDPFHSSRGYIEGNDPYADFFKTGDTLSNILEPEILSNGNEDLSWGSYSGHNSMYLSGFAEKFVTGAGKKIQGLLLYVDRNFDTGLKRSVNIKVWNGTDLPGDVIYEKPVRLNQLVSGTLNFIEFDTIVETGSVFYAGYEILYDLPMDTFSIYMAKSRTNGGVNTAYIYDGEQWAALDDYSQENLHSSYALFPVVYDSIPQAYTPVFKDEVIAYPVPASYSIRIRFREVLDLPVHITMTNMQGQTVFNESYGPMQHIIPIGVAGIADGLYMVHVKQGENVYILKVAVIR